MFMRNLTMMTDLYQLTMMYGYFRKGMEKRTATFDMFFRRGNVNMYAVVAGLEQAIDYVKRLEFNEDDLAYLRSLKLFDDDFLALLGDLKFTGDIYALPEGSIVFPGEPIVEVTAPILQAQLVETTLLNIINHQTLIASKSCRVCMAAQGDDVSEFGLRRAQGPDAGIYGARAAVIGGCTSTSNVMTGEMYHIPIKGTHAHSWVMSFDDEISAFRAYAEVFPTACLLLVDTYDTLRSGVPNAITVFRELRAKGYEPIGIRLDSGDLAYLSKRARKMLDEAGFPKAKIFASNDLDENIIWDLKAQGAAIDSWGVGTKLITSNDCPALGGVYKMVSENDEQGNEIPKIKISENAEKITTPCRKNVYRLYERATGRAIADLMTLRSETIDDTKPLTIFHPEAPWKRMEVTDFKAVQLLQPIFVNGQCRYETPALLDIQAYAKSQVETLWDEYKRLNNPHVYKVDLSQRLYDIKQHMLSEGRKA
ncbi:MAG: nicotinate phosphoribosyltransferase [Eubacteriales bacterium]|nr:nicotinate phosphoribosyltransferase [Eubacteriales bacterium]